jgi:hypothetical protein
MTFSSRFCINCRNYLMSNAWGGYYVWRTVKYYEETGHGILKGTAISLQAWTGPLGSRRLRLPEFLDNRQGCQPYAPAAFTPQGRYPWYSFLSEAQSTLAGRIMSMKNPSKPIGSRTRGLSAWSVALYLESYYPEIRLKKCQPTYELGKP